MTGGGLWVVATPIGNLGDLSPRAVEVLAAADVVACEDTRRTGRLLEHAGVRSPGYVVVNDHTENDRIDALVARLAAGETVALVTDAGTPAVSDPGERLVAAALDAGHPVRTVPGPSAAVAALSISGLPSGRFCFEGFLPRKGTPRAARLTALATETRTTVIYEAPHRVERTAGDLLAALEPDRPVVMTRELTKLHEEVWRGRLADLPDRVAGGVRGEVVLVVGGAPPIDDPDDDDIRAALAAVAADGLSTRDAAAEVASRLGVGRRRVYAIAIGSDP